MKPKLMLCIASGLMIFHIVGHSIGMAQWQHANSPEQQAVVTAMTSHYFPFMGATHSFADYYIGFGTSCTIAMALFAALLWYTGRFARAQPAIAKIITLMLFISLIAWCVVEFVFFFPFAACISLLAALFTGAAALQLWRRRG